MQKDYIPLLQITAVTGHDQAGRTVTTLYGLDTAGRLWALQDSAWARVDNPETPTPA